MTKKEYSEICKLNAILNASLCVLDKAKTEKLLKEDNRTKIWFPKGITQLVEKELLAGFRITQKLIIDSEHEKV